MSDFVNDFWSAYVTVISLVSIIGCAVFLKLSTKRVAVGEKLETTGHVWDEDLSEWNNPLPGWWRWLFYITIAFALVYLALYPGLGSYPGFLGWTSRGQYNDELAQADAKYGPLFDKYLKQDLKVVALDPVANQMGQRLFLTYCYQCHGSDAGGGPGFPNLRDNDWLHGGDPEAIQTSITDGRIGVMPAWEPILGEQGVKQVANYVLSLSGKPHDAELASAGKHIFATNCAACHGSEGKGNQIIGAPNLTDQIWLYGGSEQTIIKTIAKGRRGDMPAWKDILGEGKIHLLAAYVYSLSPQGQK